MGNPDASVIITAQDRRRYLRNAIDSVLDQAIPRSRFELIVVKNFPDAEIDSFLDGEGATRILCSERSVGLKTVEGIRASRGTVLLLLDDDDLFEPEKLRTVLSEFESHPRLGFYHNQQTYIGPDGTPIDRNRLTLFGQRVSGRARRVLLDANPTAEDLRRLTYTYPDFNASSLAIRRDLAIGTFPYLRRLEGSVDRFFFFAALLSPYTVLIDSRVLTRYRVHAANASLAGKSSPDFEKARLLAFAQQQEERGLLIRKMVLQSGNLAVLREMDGRIVVDQLTSVYRDLRRGRADAVRALVEGIRLGRTSAIRENVPSMVGAVLFSVAPAVARAVYERQVLIR